MARDAISITIHDVSDFARALRLAAEEGAEPGGQPAGHQTWLNRVARAAGYRNFQHLSALRKGAEPDPAPDQKALTRALRYFDAEGLFLRWPSRTGVQHLCLWPVWAGLPRGLSMSEREVSARIDALTRFRDAAQIRRTLVEMGLMTRRIDGSDYRRVERPPTPEARALIAAVTERRK